MANNPWFRLWGDMVNDPKWRTIARVADQKISDVLATYLHMMTLASNATERGRTQGFKDEDVATALDLRTDQVTAIRDAMQGRVLEGDYLTGWEKRQPLREDGSAERSKQHREMEKLKNEVEKLKNELIQAQANAGERNRTQSTAREDKIREEDNNHTPAANGGCHDLLDKPKPDKPQPPTFDAKIVLVSLGVSAQTAKDWLQLRKSKRAPVSETALTAIVRESEKAKMTLNQALEISCKRGWTGFEAHWVKPDDLLSVANGRLEKDWE